MAQFLEQIGRKPANQTNTGSSLQAIGRVSTRVDEELRLHLLIATAPLTIWECAGWAPPQRGCRVGKPDAGASERERSVCSVATEVPNQGKEEYAIAQLEGRLFLPRREMANLWR